MHPMFVELFLAEDADEPAGKRDKRRAASRARRARVLVRRAARQHASGGPVVAVSPFYRRQSRNMQITAQLAVAFRTVDDGRLHVLAEADVQGLKSFTMPFRPGGPSPYAGRDLQYYYRPVPGLAVADLGRSAGYTLRPEGFGIAFCITEEVMDELFGPPFIGSPERQRWEVGLKERSETGTAGRRA